MQDSTRDLEHGKLLLGCCGAYCRTCKDGRRGFCKGCKTGYADGSRDLSKAKCKMKVCCMTKDLISCADCDDFDTCEILNGFYNKNGYKYKKYQDALIRIREKGYKTFFTIANNWTNAYGKL